MSAMRLMDCHCHIDVGGVLKNPKDFYLAITSDERSNVKEFFNLMTTNHLDLHFLERVLEFDEHKVIIPYFGIHPWYAHLFSIEENVSKSDHYKKVLSNLTDDLLRNLPEPIYLATYLDQIRDLARNCERNGRLYGIGEIGLDKVFRIPSNGFYGNPFTQSKDVGLTSAKTLMDHQTVIFKCNLHLAEELKRPVSLHCVKAHGPFFDILSESFLNVPKLVFHSYTGSVDQAKRWLAVTQKQQRKLFFSFSDIINGTPEKEEASRSLIALLGKEQLLIETDLAIDRCFLNESKNTYFEALKNVKMKLIAWKKWDEMEGASRLRDNYRALLD